MFLGRIRNVECKYKFSSFRLLPHLIAFRIPWERNKILLICKLLSNYPDLSFNTFFTLNKKICVKRERENGFTPWKIINVDDIHDGSSS